MNGMINPTPQEPIPQELDRLYQLLPVIYRQRDEQYGLPLRDLLRVIAEQVDVVEEDILQLYENWFIETCQDWVVPYIGDLIGYQPVHEAGEPGATAEERRRNRILIPRQEVANTIQSRRRRGTLAILEEISRATAGWPARAVEFFRLLAFTQSLNHLRPGRGGWVDLRDADALDLIDSPFDRLGHTVDVRSVASTRTQARYNLPSVGLFVWRLKEYPVTRGQCACLEEDGLPFAFTFSFLGNDAPRFARLSPETDPAHIADETNLPVPIRRLAFERDKERFYGDGKSIQIWIGVVSADNRVVLEPVPPDRIIPADLSDWERYRPPQGHLGVDPVLGRIIFHPADSPAGVWASYYYGFSADIGGGEYSRPHREEFSEPAELFYVGEGEEFGSIEEALEKWSQNRPRNAIIEIRDNGVYSDPLYIVLERGQSLQIRAANHRRPIIYLHEIQKNRPEWLGINSETGGCLTLEGLMITGRNVRVTGKVEQVKIRHCTLVPGWGIKHDCEPQRPSRDSIELYKTNCRLSVEQSIIGSIQVYKDEVRSDPLTIKISDSILDATSDDLEAIGAPNWPRAHAILHLARSTVIGLVQAHAIALAEDCIFTGKISVTRRQFGCLRFCYVPPGSRTPNRYQCQPDMVEEAAEQYTNDALTPAELTAIRAILRAAERLRVEPQFESKRYGRPDYCQLSTHCAKEIKRGASDESEMGAFHDLFQPQREANLRARLDEFMPAGMEAGIIFAS